VNNKECRRRAVTLIELLVVIAIIGVLTSITLPAVQGVRERIRAVACGNNLHQIINATLNFESAHHKLPPGTLGYSKAVPWDAYRNSPSSEFYWTRVQHTSYAVFLLPFIEQSSIYQVLDKSLVDTSRYLDNPNVQGFWYADVRGFHEVSNATLSVYHCPSDSLAELTSIQFTGGSQPVLFPDASTDALSFQDFLSDLSPTKYSATNYLGCAGAFSGGIHPDPARAKYVGAFSSRNAIRFSNVRDGSSHTLAFGETLGEISDNTRLYAQPWNVGGLARGRGAVPWGQAPIGPLRFLGNRKNASAFGFGSSHNICNFAMLDGSLRAIDGNIEQQVFYSLCGISDANIVE